MKNKIYLVLLLLSALPLLSCTRGNFLSSQVAVKFCGSSRVFQRGGKAVSICEPPTVLHVPGNNKRPLICRKGAPDNFVTPWDAEFLARGNTNRTTEGAGSDATEGTARPNVITQEVGGYWFKVFPVINNKSQFYLLVSHITLSARSGGNSREGGDTKPFDGSYCGETPHLYILDNSGRSTASLESRGARFAQGSYTSYGDVERTFVQGNLVFYMKDLPGPDLEKEDSAVIPHYFVEWKIFGSFHTERGDQVGTFYKRGFFTTRRSSL